MFVPSMCRDGPRPKLDIPGALLVSGALLRPSLRLLQRRDDGGTLPLRGGCWARAVVLLIAFVAGRRAGHPLLPLPIVLDRNRGAAFLSVLVAGAGCSGSSCSSPTTWGSR